MMKYRQIGHSGKQASAVTFGAMGIGGGFRYPDADDTTSIAAVHAALDAGITTFDTAPVYGFGHSEEVLGRALAGRRDDVVISTKCGLWWGDDEGTYRFTWDGNEVKRNLSPRTIRIEVEESLRRLDTDHIDIYYTHNPTAPPFVTPIEDTIEVLTELRDEGKILEIGASNCPRSDVEAYLARDAIQIVQRKFSLFDRGVRTELLPFLEKQQLSLHAYSPLGNGLLGGGFTVESGAAPAGSRDTDPLFGEHFERSLAFVDGVRGIANELGSTVPALSIAYLLAVSERVNVITGIRKPSHIADAVSGAQLELPEGTVARLDALADAFDASIEAA
ncbi:aldo/keto reductase [Leucobacter komagatae]|nr:aldo/keto reductase [Leucobacter komagatae]